MGERHLGERHRNDGRRQRRHGERGFALLVVFLIAAGVLISLYMEIPRVAFESQRNREEQLIERGEEYKRAIELFYRKTKRYPSKMEDLESYNNQRFLRRRYKDPLTGKDEWRLIHMGATGQLTDSLVEKPGQLAGAGGKPGDPNAQTSANLGAGANNGMPVDPNAPVNPDDVNVAANRLRQSDRQGAPGRVTAMGPGAGSFSNPNQDPNALGQQDPNAIQQTGNFDPNAGNGNPNFNNPNFNNPNLNNPNGINPNFNNPNFNNPNFNNPNFNNPNFNNPNGINPTGPPGTFTPTTGVNFNRGPNFPGANGPNQTGFGTDPNGQQFPGQQMGSNLNYQTPNGALFGSPGSQQPGNNPALNSINNQLRNPNQSGFGQSGFGQSGFGQSGFNQGQQQQGQTGFGQQLPGSAGGSGTPFGAGIAGVASTEPGVGIKRYNDRKKYKEWEFVFDYRKPKNKPGGPGQGVPGLQSGQLGNSLGQQQQQQPQGQNPNPMGQNPFQNTGPGR